MKRIIFAAMTAMAMLAFSNVAEASRGMNTQYSKREEVTFDPISDLLGGSNWNVTPQFRVHYKRSTFCLCR